MSQRVIQGSAKVGQEVERIRGKRGREDLLWFPWEGMDEAG